MENNNRTLVSPKQLQAVLEEGGCSFCIQTIYKLMETPGFPVVKIGERKFAVKEMVLPWLLDRQSNTNIMEE